MDTPTHPLQVAPIPQASDQEPTLGTALWTLAGFIVFAAVIFALVIYGHF
jgi:hypothetical protein